MPRRLAHSTRPRQWLLTLFHRQIEMANHGYHGTVILPAARGSALPQPGGHLLVPFFCLTHSNSSSLFQQSWPVDNYYTSYTIRRIDAYSKNNAAQKNRG
jgi:hypothetical protein